MLSRWPPERQAERTTYLRVSTTGQTTDNQLQEIAAAGFKVEPRRVVTETVSVKRRYCAAPWLHALTGPPRARGRRCGASRLAAAPPSILSP